MRVRDELGEVFADGAFIDAFGIRRIVPAPT